MINVTKTYLPDFDKYTEMLKRAWDKAWITNNGELVQELEQKLKDYLGVKHLLFTSNGTIVLQMALKVFNITKEVITTPFSYVATTNAILWEGATPVFVDIEPQTFCIDADKIEEAITENTEAILATHVYGFPCNVEKIESIAKKHNLKVIYDGAHAFGCQVNGKSLLSYGDISTCSFHATKVFHTVEGGCIITDDDALAQKIMHFRQFGHMGDDYYSIGINAKNSEFHAAMGLCVLDDFQDIISYREKVFSWYSELLNKEIRTISIPTASQYIYNYSYFPIVLNSEEKIIKVRNELELNKISTRRYFYPSLNKLPFLGDQQCLVSEDIASRVICLPLFFGITRMEIEKICKIVNASI